MQSPSDAEIERLRQNEGSILGQGRFSEMGKRRCKLSVSVPNGSTFIAGSEEWSMQLGTPMTITARCLEGRVFHWALLTGGILLPKGINNAMIDGVTEVTITIVKPVSSVPLVFFVSDRSVMNLAAAVEKGDAKPAGMRVVTAGNAAN
ncbi:MAG: hypothetical protein SF187_00580 [Deltaproteobacteria bacterium]|nr:hypothetical protein [Deltaproteobacteria bacterium]